MRIWFCLTSWLALSLGLALLTRSEAAVIGVPGDQPTIQQAIDIAADGDTVLVAAGTYVELIDFRGKAITLVSEAGRDATVVDGNQAGSVVTFATGEGRASILDGFTLQHGNAGSNVAPFASDGGGIRIDHASPTIQNSAIVDNTACDGAGISVAFGSPLIGSNIVARNKRSGCSGGIGGGGILLGGAGAAEILDNVIADNVSGADGGGLSLFAAGAPVIRNNLISGNSARVSGGGISLANGNDALILQNVVAGNRAPLGGGIGWSVGFIAIGTRIISNTIVDNDGQMGSGLYAIGFTDKSMVRNNLIIARNGQNTIACEHNDSLQQPVLQFNNVFANAGSSFAGTCADQIGVAGNIFAPPLFADAASGDYRMVFGSLAIDRGDDTVAGLIATDFEGAPRVLDGNGDGVPRIDMGALEFDPALPLAMLMPASHDYGSVEIGTSADFVFTLKNAGGSTTTYTVRTSGTFSLTSAASLTLGPGESREIVVRFLPTAPQPFTGSLDVSFADQIVSRTLLGNGLAFFTLAVVRHGSDGVTVASAPAGIDCGSACSARFPGGSSVMLTVTLGRRVVLDTWTGCDVVTGPQCTVTLTSDRNVTVVTEALAALAVTKSGNGGGMVVSTPAGIQCGATCVAQFGDATSVTLTATPDTGSVFTGWSLCEGTAPCTTTLTVPRLVTATFRRLPDLTLTALTTAATGQTGRPLTVTVTARNIGLVAAPLSRLAFFMSAADPAPGAGTAIGFRDVGGLGPGASTVLNVPVTVPADLAAGAYFVSAIADSIGAVDELSETNNGLTASAPVTISVFRPDLTITALTAPLSGQTGRPLSVSTTVRNRGPAPASVFRVTYYMSPSDATPGAGQSVGFSDISGLPAGTNVSITASLPVPLNFDAGDYFFSAVVDSGNRIVELDETNNGRTAPSPVTVSMLRADLTVVAVTAPPTGQTGRPLSVGALVRNIGGAPAPAFRVAFFMSATDPMPGAGVLIGVRDVPGLAPSMNASVVTSATVPITSEAGDYFVSAVADSGHAVVELDETNNGRTTSGRVAIALVRPDLTISALTVPTTGQTGKPLSVSARLSNVGQAAAPAFRVAFFMSPTDATPGAGTQVGFRDVSSLAAGANASVARTVAVPISLPAGTYFFSAVADTGAAVVELDDSNNGLTAPNQVTVSLVRAELSILTLTTAPVAQTGRPLAVLATLRNGGQASSGPFRLAFFMSPADPAPGAGAAVGARDIAGIAAGANASVSTTVTLPLAFDPGPYFFSAIVDSANAVTEVDETNNGRTAATPVVVSLLRSDLAIGPVSTPTRGQLGQPLPVTTIVRNLGSIPSPAFRLTIFMSASDSTPGAGVAVGVRDVPGVAPGVNTSVVTTITVPSALPVGTYFVSAVADIGGQVPEIDEGNNGRTAAAPVTITPFVPKVVVTSYSAPPLAVAGRILTVTSTVRNVGSAPSGTVSASFYLSADGSINRGSVLLGSRSVSGLRPDASSTAASSFVIPASLPPFDYVLLARAEGQDEAPLGPAPSIAVVPNFAGSFTMNLTLQFSDCTDGTFNGGSSGFVTLRIPVHTGAAFGGTASFTSVASGITVVTTVTFAGNGDTHGDFAGTFKLRSAGRGVTLLSSTSTLAGSVLGREITGGFNGTLNIVTGDTCVLRGTFAARPL